MKACERLPDCGSVLLGRGLDALTRVLAPLPADLAAAVLVLQDMSSDTPVTCWTYSAAPLCAGCRSTVIMPRFLERVVITVSGKQGQGQRP